MGKTYNTANIVKNSTVLDTARIIGVAGPYDVRSIVDTYDDLYNKDTFGGLGYIYLGMTVTVLETNDLYVLIKKPANSRVDYTSNIQWKKVGGSDFNPEDVATKIFSSVDSLTDGTIAFPYRGMIAFVDGDASDEDGLYILLNTPATDINNWKKIEGTSSTSIPGFNYDPNGGFDQNNAPEGITITTDDTTLVTEYITSENPVKADDLYTSQGIMSSGESSNPLLENVEYIDVYPADGDGESYIRLYKDGENWINIVGGENLGLDNVTLEGGENYEGGDIAKGDKVSFGEDLNLDGWNVKTDNGDEYTFGDEIGYDDIDVYKENNLPAAYITVNNVTERILTESDKDDINIETIPDEDIEGLFN